LLLLKRDYHVLTRLDNPALDFLLKRYPNGKASGYLHSLIPGSTLFFLTAPKGYTWAPNAFPHIVLLAGGAGITPVYQLARGILQNPSDKARITLVHGINSDAVLLLKEEFEEFERRFPGRFRRVVTVSKPGERSPFRKGDVNVVLLEEVIGIGRGERRRVMYVGRQRWGRHLRGGRGF
jgi:cytochrome-b5 reductase